MFMVAVVDVGKYLCCCSPEKGHILDLLRPPPSRNEERTTTGCVRKVAGFLSRKRRPSPGAAHQASAWSREEQQRGGGPGAATSIMSVSLEEFVSTFVTYKYIRLRNPQWLGFTHFVLRCLLIVGYSTCP